MKVATKLLYILKNNIIFIIGAALLVFSYHFIRLKIWNMQKKSTITRNDLEGYSDEIYKNYIIACNFTDYAFGKFMQELDDAGLLENSILVVYGDHGAGMSLDLR